MTDIATALTEAQTKAAAVTAAEKALKTAESNKAAAIEAVKQQIKEAEEALKALGVTVVTSFDEAKTALQEKLDEGKLEWADLAATNPDEARRYIRKTWAIIAGSAGLVIGGLIGYLAGFIL